MRIPAHILLLSLVLLFSFPHLVVTLLIPRAAVRSALPRHRTTTLVRPRLLKTFAPLFCTSSDKVQQPLSSTEVSCTTKKYKCAGCSYVFDEAKGFKKRYPPGTVFKELKTFMCPVCGAAKDQFHEDFDA